MIDRKFPQGSSPKTGGLDLDLTYRSRGSETPLDRSGLRSGGLRKTPVRSGLRSGGPDPIKNPWT